MEENRQLSTVYGKDNSTGGREGGDEWVRHDTWGGGKSKKIRKSCIRRRGAF